MSQTEGVKVKKTKNRTEELLGQVLAALVDLRNLLEKPVTSQLPTGIKEATTAESTTATNEPPATAPQETVNSCPVPVDYRDVVDSVLNKSFDIEIEPHTDAPVVTVSIIVPDKYSNIPPSQREIMKRDVRPKVIGLAEGVNGVREWAERVFKNLGPEMQAMVVADRVQGS